MLPSVIVPPDVTDTVWPVVILAELRFMSQPLAPALRSMQKLPDESVILAQVAVPVLIAATPVAPLVSNDNTPALTDPLGLTPLVAPNGRMANAVVTAPRVAGLVPL